MKDSNNDENSWEPRPIDDFTTNEIKQQVEKNKGQAFGKLSNGQAIQFNEEAGFIVFADNAQISQGGGIAVSSKPPISEVYIPHLLPYLPDRREQEAELRSAIQRFMAEKTNRPIVCIVHGDHIQSHDMYLKRLEQITIPKLLGLDLAKAKCQSYLLPWPSSLKNLDLLADRLHKGLAEAIEHNCHASIDKVNQTISLQPVPVILYTYLNTDNWREQGQSLLGKLLEFWQAWPPLQSDNPLFVYLFIKYQVKPYQGFNQTLQSQDQSFFLRLNSWFRSVLLTYQRDQINRKIQSKLDQLSTSSPETAESLNCVVLSKLEGIKRLDMENWAHSQEFQNFAGSNSLNHYIKEIARIFDEWEQTTGFSTMPMDIIAKEIIKSIEAYGMAMEKRP